MAKRDDVLIVGAGVIGLSLAWELARHGSRVRILDRGPAGRAASWAGAGIITPAAERPADHSWDRLRGLSFRLHAEWAERLRALTGIDTGYRRSGGLYLARGAGEAAALRAICQSWADESVRVEAVEPGDLSDRFGSWLNRQFLVRCRAAAWLPDESQIRNPQHLLALCKACEMSGVVLETGNPVTSIERIGERLAGVVTAAGPRFAEQVCFASGAWTHALLHRWGLGLEIMPIRGQMLLFDLKKPGFSCIVNEGSRYIVPRDDGKVLVGSTEEEVGFDESTTDEAVESLLEFAGSLCESLDRAALVRSWAGLRPGSFDGFPYLGRLPGLANAWVAAGHFRSGLFLSAGTARVMAQAIRGEVPEIDLTPFRPARG